MPVLEVYVTSVDDKVLPRPERVWLPITLQPSTNAQQVVEAVQRFARVMHWTVAREADLVPIADRSHPFTEGALIPMNTDLALIPIKTTLPISAAPSKNQDASSPQREHIRAQHWSGLAPPSAQAWLQASDMELALWQTEVAALEAEMKRLTDQRQSHQMRRDMCEDLRRNLPTEGAADAQARKDAVLARIESAKTDLAQLHHPATTETAKVTASTSPPNRGGNDHSGVLRPLDVGSPQPDIGSDVMGEEFLPDEDDEPGAAMSGHARVTQQIFRFVARRCPEKLPQLDEILTRYEGREEAVLEAFIDRYGPEDEPVAPARSPQPSAVSPLLKRLHAISPRLQSELDGILQSKHTMHHLSGAERRQPRWRLVAADVARCLEYPETVTYEHRGRILERLQTMLDAFSTMNDDE